MKKKYYTGIIEFEVIKPTNDMETIGEKLKLSQFGEYCPDNSLRGYGLLHLLDNPLFYRVSKIIMQGRVYIIPADREKNYAKPDCEHKNTSASFNGGSEYTIQCDDCDKIIDD